MSKGFTLLELLIVIAILAILATLIVMVLDPVETLRKARDVQRISDLSTLKTAIILFISEQGGGAAIGGPGAEDDKVCWVEGAKGPCVSTTKPVSGAHNPTDEGHKPVELVYGWLPIDFTLIKGSSLISSLPVDPINTAEYYYRYSTNGTDFILDCKLESKYYKEKVELGKTDGGACDNSYEVGTDLTMYKNHCRP